MLFGEQTVFAKSQGATPIQKGVWIAILSKMVTTTEEVTVKVDGKEVVQKKTRKAPKSFSMSFEAEGRLDAKNQVLDEIKGTDTVLEYVYKA